MDKGSTGGLVHVQGEFYELRWSAVAYTGTPNPFYDSMNQTGCTASGSFSEMGFQGQARRCCLRTPAKEKAVNIA